MCHEGCVHGVCTHPDTCSCHFGFVGKNCSTECDCNRHSNCESVERKNVCLDCRNNTKVSGKKGFRWGLVREYQIKLLGQAES